jgi:hypothetical protein
MPKSTELHLKAMCLVQVSMKQPLGRIKTNACMHSPCNTVLSFHEPIHFLPLHFHAHFALEEDAFEAHDLGLELNLQKNPTKKFSKFNVSLMRVLHHTVFLE